MSSTSALPRRATAIWLVLVVVTGATFWLGTDHPFSGLGVRFASSLALAVAFLKAYLIGQDFMEVRGAPLTLRIAFMTWIAVFGAVTVALYAV